MTRLTLFKVFICVVLVACLMLCSGCGFHFGRTKTPEGALDESLKIDLLQSNFSRADEPGPLLRCPASL